MKRINIFNAIPVIALAVAFVSCEKQFQYTPAPAESVSKTYVGADVNANRNVEAGGEDLQVSFVRNTTSGALEVNLFLEDTTGIFTLKTPTITFADGDSLASALVSYDYADLVMDVRYDITVGVADTDLVSQYLPANASISCIKAWENLGTAQFYDDWWLGFVCEKTLLKSPDGSLTYRLVEPWSEDEVTDAGLDFVSQLPYLEFAVDDEGIITYARRLDMGFTFSGMTCHMLHPSARNDAESAAKNLMVMPNVAQFTWYPILDYNPETGGFRWWGTTGVAYISFPGGPDLVELLGLGGE